MKNIFLKALTAAALLLVSPVFAVEPKVATVIAADGDPPSQIIVVGNGVRSPGAIAYAAEMTVMKAILRVGGYAEFAHARVYLIRDSISTKLDLHKILKKEEKDTPLKPWDIIYFN